MVVNLIAGRDLRSPSTLKLILIITTLAGGILVLTAVLVALRKVQCRRKPGHDFQQAYLNEPGLTWDEYGRRGRLTRSQLMFEEEVQRSDMIRKCQQSRNSDKDTATTEELPMRPPRSRSRTWHGHSRDTEADAEHGKQSPKVIMADWGSAEARVDRTWQLLHRGKSPPPPRHGLLWIENGGGTTQHPPSVRLKTPPLLSHPLFRDGNPHCRPKHTSLPTEFTRAKLEPICALQHDTSPDRDTRGTRYCLRK